MLVIKFFMSLPTKTPIFGCRFTTNFFSKPNKLTFLIFKLKDKDAVIYNKLVVKLNWLKIRTNCCNIMLHVDTLTRIFYRNEQIFFLFSDRIFGYFGLYWIVALISYLPGKGFNLSMTSALHLIFEETIFEFSSFQLLEFYSKNFFNLYRT